MALDCTKAALAYSRVAWYTEGLCSYDSHYYFVLSSYPYFCGCRNFPLIWASDFPFGPATQVVIDSTPFVKLDYWLSPNIAIPLRRSSFLSLRPVFWVLVNRWFFCLSIFFLFCVCVLFVFFSRVVWGFAWGLFLLLLPDFPFSWGFRHLNFVLLIFLLI